MKRLLSLLLVVAMLFGVCTVFTACDGSSASSEKEEEKEEKKSNRVKLNMKGVTVEEEVIYDDNDIVLTVTDMEISDYYVEVYFELENTSNERRTISCNTAVVNGISTCGYGFYHELSGGESCDAVMNMYIPTLEMLQVKTIGNIDLYLNISDEHYNRIVSQDKATVNTSEKGFVHTQEYDGEVLLEKEGIRLTLIESSFKKNEEHGLYVLVENETDEHVTVDLDDTVINGWLQPHCYFYAEVPAGTNTVAFLDMTDLEDMGIKKEKDIQNMSFYVYAYDQNYDYLFREDHVAYIPGDKDYVEKLDVEGDTVFEEGAVEIVLVDVTVEGGQPMLRLYFKNNSDDDWDICINNVEVDGTESYASINYVLPAGTQCLRNFYLYADFKVDSLDELESIIADISVYNENSYDFFEDTVEFPLN